MMAWGLLSLVALPGQWIYSQLSLNDAAAFVIPICERYVFGSTDDIVVPFEKDYRYIGANIFALKPNISSRLRFSDVFFVEEWGMYSDGLSDNEIQAFLAQLPLEVTPSEFVTPPLPNLAAETRTTLMFLGRALIDEDCSVSHVEASAIEGEMYHARQNSGDQRISSSVRYCRVCLFDASCSGGHCSRCTSSYRVTTHDVMSNVGLSGGSSKVNILPSTGNSLTGTSGIGTPGYYEIEIDSCRLHCHSSVLDVSHLSMAKCGSRAVGSGRVIGSIARTDRSAVWT